MAELVARGLRKSFGRVAVLRGVDLQVADGELVALLGASGCGKTTTLRLIAGFERPDAGEIELDGENLLGRSPEDRGIGLVFQGAALFPHLDVARNVAYGLRGLARPERRRRVSDLLDLVGLKDLAERSPGTLSAGERQRVALARALAPRPRVLLLDEPLSALDLPLRDALREEVRAIQRRLRLSTIYVTHDQGEALSVADRVAVMNGGRIEQEAPPADVYRRPSTPFVASFVGRSNRLEGQVVRADRDSGEARVREAILSFHPRGVELRVGDRVVLFVKEGDVSLGEASRGLFAGRVVSLHYHGEASAVDLESPLGPLRARVTPETGERLRPGDAVGIDVRPERVAVFLREQEGGEEVSG